METEYFIALYDYSFRPTTCKDFDYLVVLNRQYNSSYENDFLNILKIFLIILNTVL